VTRRRSRSARGRRRASSGLSRALLIGLAALIAVALASLGWLVLVYPKSAGPGRGRELSVEVDPTLDLDALAARLHEAGAIESPLFFATYARLLGAEDRLRAGPALLTDDMTPRDVLARVAHGYGEPSIRVVIPEGFDRFDVAARLERWGVCGEDEFLAATEDRALLEELGIEGPSAEGYLFPDTYRFPQGLGGADAVRRLVEGFERRGAPMFEEHGLEGLARELSWGRHEALILASIVEKEAVAEEERPIIARVFMNRLSVPGFSPRRLQADPTVSYGCRAAPELAPSCSARTGRAITRAMLQDRVNLYNTYRHEGLPPGPICNPGASSIRAVLTAAPHEYLYFVARGGGRHTFSATLEEHNAAVARLRARERRD